MFGQIGCSKVRCSILDCTVKRCDKKYTKFKLKNYQYCLISCIGHYIFGCSNLFILQVPWWPAWTLVQCTTPSQSLPTVGSQVTSWHSLQSWSTSQRTQPLSSLITGSWQVFLFQFTLLNILTASFPVSSRMFY